MGKTSAMPAYSAPAPSTDLVCIDRPGGVSYKATLDYFASVLRPGLDAGGHAFGQTTIENGVKAASSMQGLFGTTDALPMQLIISNITNVAMDVQSVEQGIGARALYLNVGGGPVDIGAVGYQTLVHGPLTAEAQFGVAFGLKIYSNVFAVFTTIDPGSPIQLTIGNTLHDSIDLNSIEQGIAYRAIRLNPVSGPVGIASAAMLTTVYGPLLVGDATQLSVTNIPSTSVDVQALEAGVGRQLRLNPLGGQVSVGSPTTLTPLTIQGANYNPLLAFINAAGDQRYILYHLGPTSLRLYDMIDGQAVWTDNAGGVFAIEKELDIGSNQTVHGNSTFLGTLTALTVSGITAQSDARITVRTVRDCFEWGHPNTFGYGSTIGDEASTGAPYVAFHAEAGTTIDTYQTRGKKGSVLRSDMNGGFIFGCAIDPAADDQILTVLATLNPVGMHLRGRLDLDSGVIHTLNGLLWLAANPDQNVLFSGGAGGLRIVNQANNFVIGTFADGGNLNISGSYVCENDGILFARYGAGSYQFFDIRNTGGVLHFGLEGAGGGLVGGAHAFDTSLRSSGLTLSADNGVSAQVRLDSVGFVNILVATAAIPTPAAGSVNFFVDSADGAVKYKKPDGSVVVM